MNAQTEEAITDWLVSTLSGVLGVGASEIDTGKPFSYHGLGSTESVMIVGELETWLGCVFPETLAFDYPSIDALARHLDGHLSDYRSRRSA